MPPRASTSNNGFRGTGPFKPPRPTGRPSDNSGSSSSAADATSRRIEISDDDDNDNENDENNESNENDAGVDTEVATDNEDTTAAAAAAPSEPAIPPALLSRLLSHFFQNHKGTPTRLTQDAHASIDKYMEIFIREAVARSVAARTDEAFLDVDVLQKIAGQLIMDM
ncbi:hypothetical protein F503_00278 [Ophiostoma piceae UAMH 11346]|uniref:Centromere protein x n=1 Tax=Ophiostoma piceae (strain UAMH 11346) TaxID=1262450 RepID=S3C6N7_OPHP1|nr:hypothetical protein F503_00278 [Ophiostoma piceae UAMH 11346]